MSKRVFKNDKFKSARGGHTRLLKISCEECNSHICLYQKDGSGNLRRMYLDRIIDPVVSVSKKELVCKKDHILGIRILYKKENRPAFRLFTDSVVKKIVKL